MNKAERTYLYLKDIAIEGYKHFGHWNWCHREPWPQETKNLVLAVEQLVKDKVKDLKLDFELGVIDKATLSHGVAVNEQIKKFVHDRKKILGLIKEDKEMDKSKNDKMTNSEIMREAHRRAKTYKGDYQACFTLAIREVWREVKHGKPDSVTVTNNIVTYHYDDKVLHFRCGTMSLIDKQKDDFKETSQPSKVNTPKKEIKEVEVPKLELDKETQLIEAAIKRVIAGRARSKTTGYSGIDSIDDLGYLWENSYKFDWYKDSDGEVYNAGALLNSVNGDIYNECYIEGRKVLATKNFEHDGQAVNYLALRFGSRIRDHWQGYDSGKTTLQLKKESKGHYKSLDVQETRRKLESDVLQCHSVEDITEYIALNQDMQKVFTSKEMAAIKALAQGYTHRQIAQAGIASNRTIQKAKKKLYPWLKERIAQ